MREVIDNAMDVYLRSVSHYGFFKDDWTPFIKSGLLGRTRTPKGTKPKPKNPMDAYPKTVKPLPVLMKRLSDTDDLHFFCMIWAIHGIQSNRVALANRFLHHPREAETTDKMSLYMVHKWELETLVSLDLNTPKDLFPVHLRKPINTREFEDLADTVNLLKAVEDGQSSDRISVETIMRELHRISHRQFPWQIGWDNVGSVYRHIFIYGQGLCAEYFEATYGLSISDFIGCCFALYVQLQQSPWTPMLESTQPVTVADGALEKTLDMVSSELWTMRRESAAMLQKFQEALKTKLPVAYFPSYLRIKPIIRSAAMGDRCIAPLHQFILMRATVGLFYDIIGGGTKVMNDARDRFEEYGRKVIEAYCPEFKADPALQYKYNKQNVDTPDILMKQNGNIVAVFECKATKLTFQAQYGDDPAEDAKDGYLQIAKAVFQLWRFFSHVRRGFIELPIAGNASAIVLTMEPWTQTSKELRVEMMKEAERLVAEKDPDITEEDRKFPLFVPITELERIMSESTHEQVLATFHAATNDRYDGWGIREIRRDAVPDKQEPKRYPFDPSELLPWWKEIRDKRDKDKEND